MAEMLSNDEIDDLLKAFQQSGLEDDGGASTELLDRDIRHFDFTRPRRFRRNQLGALQGIHEEAARRLRVAIAEGLKVQANIELSSWEQIRFESFLSHLPDRPVVYAIHVESFPVPGLIAVDHNLLFAGIDRLLGGPGRAAIAAREPTKLEDLVAGHFVQKILVGFTAAWATTSVQLDFVTDARLAGPALLGVMDPKEVGYSVTYDFSGSFPNGQIRVLLPYRGLQPYLEVVAPESGTPGEPRGRTAAMHNALLPVQVHLGVTLGDARLTVQDIMNLDKDDVILLDRRITDPVDVTVCDLGKFQGRMGTSGKKYAVRIEGPSFQLNDDETDDSSKSNETDPARDEEASAKTPSGEPSSVPETQASAEEAP